MTEIQKRTKATSWLPEKQISQSAFEELKDELGRGLADFFTENDLTLDLNLTWHGSGETEGLLNIALDEEWQRIVKIEIPLGTAGNAFIPILYCVASHFWPAPEPREVTDSVYFNLTTFRGLFMIVFNGELAELALEDGSAKQLGERTH